MLTGKQIQENFHKLVSYKSGPLKNLAVSVCSETNPKKNHLIYVGKKKCVTPNVKSLPSIVVLEKTLEKYWEPNNAHQCLFLCEDIGLTMALVNSKFFPTSFFPRKFDGESIHPSAVISKTAQIGANCIIAPQVTISENCKIGKNVYIGPQVTLAPNVSIGDNSYLEAHIFVGRNCHIGKNCKIQSFTNIGGEGFGYAVHPDGYCIHKPHMGRVILGDDINIGAHVNIDRGMYEDTSIGNRCKIGNHCHFSHNIKIGENCIFVGNFICAGSTTIEDHCVFYGVINVIGHIRIVSRTTVYASSNITKSISEPGDYLGQPAIKKRKFLKQQAVSRNLFQIKKQVQQILKKLDTDKL